MFEKVRALLAKQFCIPEQSITPQFRIREDLGADSLDIMELLMSIEEDYGLTIPDEKLADFVTVQDIADYLDNLN